MSNFKPIETIITPPATHWVGDGFKVHNFFPHWQYDEDRMSPFFLLDYNAKMQVPPSTHPRGVGPHPHRGFETVTIAYHGSVAHHDSAGNSGVIGQGDVQWMTAGSGVLHKEYYEKTYNQQGGPFQMVQLWVNLPSQYKMTSPQYQAILDSQMGVYRYNDDNYIKIIAGQIDDIKGPAHTFSPVHLYNAYLNNDYEIKLNFPSTYNTAALILEGQVTLQNQHTVRENHLVLFQNSGEEISLKASQKSLVLLLSGEPLNEPIASYGPFLMNTEQELHQAMADFRSGKFGALEE